MKIKLKSTLNFNDCFVSKLIWSRNRHWNKTITQTFHKITCNNIILARRAIKFLDLNCLYISKVLAFLDYVLLNLKRLEPSRKRENFCPKNFIKIVIIRSVYSQLMVFIDLSILSFSFQFQLLCPISCTFSLP